MHDVMLRNLQSSSRSFTEKTLALVGQTNMRVQNDIQVLFFEKQSES